MRSTRVRMAYLRVLRALGVRHFIAASSLGYPFVCHVGDSFGENPYYNSTACVPELTLAASWLLQEYGPLVIDAGANVGFWCTQLAQMASACEPDIYSFEPVPDTLCKLVRSISTLELGGRIHAIPAGLSDSHRILAISTNSAHSGYAQAGEGQLNPRAGCRLQNGVFVSLDEFLAHVDGTPSLLKIDVEGSEVAVLRGARRLLERSPPAQLIEVNPTTLAERGQTTASLFELLPMYEFHYVDDFEGQRMPFGEPVRRPQSLDWVCNLFAVPCSDTHRERFGRAFLEARRRLAGCAS